MATLHLSFWGDVALEHLIAITCLAMCVWCALGVPLFFKFTAILGPLQGLLLSGCSLQETLTCLLALKKIKTQQLENTAVYTWKFVICQDGVLACCGSFTILRIHPKIGFPLLWKNKMTHVCCCYTIFGRVNNHFIHFS